MKTPTTLGEVFLAAAEALEREEAGYICHAVHAVARREADLRLRAELVILGRLGSPYITYLEWIQTHHAHLIKGLDYETRQARARQGRIAWCKALAEEFKDVK